MQGRPADEVFYTHKNCGICLYARVEDFQGDLVLQADLSAVTVQVFDLDLNNAKTSETTPDVTDVLYDTAQQNDAWPFDDGFNFAYIVPAAAFASGGHRYQVQVLFTPTAGEAYAMRIPVQVIDLL